MSGLRHYTVMVGGVLVGERRSPRPYSHAIVARYIEAPNPEFGTKLFVHGFARTRALAEKAAATLAGRHYGYGAQKGARIYTDVQVVEVAVREIQARVRTRCEGLKLVTRQEQFGPWSSTARCLKDAATFHPSEGNRCADCEGVDNAAVRAEAERSHAAYNAASQRHWAERHAAEFTAETCPIVNGCRVHQEVAG